MPARPSSAAAPPPSSGERGQATVEFVGLLPVLAVLGALVWQAAVAGHLMWSATAAARAAARAVAVGADADDAARHHLPPHLAESTRVRADDDGRVRVSVPVRAVVGGRRLTTYTASARFEPQR
jgi:hypothetical protein